MKSFVVPVGNLEAATITYRALLGIDPHVESPYYVGFRVDELEIGLTPVADGEEPTGPVAFWHVDDLSEMLDALSATGATVLQEPQEVGAGVSIARAADAYGNPIGLIQD